MTCSCAEKVVLTFQSWEVNKYLSRNPDLAAIFSHRCRNSTLFRNIQQPYCCAPPTEEPKQIEKITDRVYCLCHRQLISRLGLGNSQGVDGDVRYFNRKYQGEREGLSSSKLHRPGKGLKTNLKYWCVLSFQFLTSSASLYSTNMHKPWSGMLDRWGWCWLCDLVSTPAKHCSYALWW